MQSMQAAVTPAQAVAGATSHCVAPLLKVRAVHGHTGRGVTGHPGKLPPSSAAGHPQGGPDAGQPAGGVDRGPAACTLGGNGGVCWPGLRRSLRHWTAGALADTTTRCQHIPDRLSSGCYRVWLDATLCTYYMGTHKARGCRARATFSAPGADLGRRGWLEARPPLARLGLHSRMWPPSFQWRTGHSRLQSGVLAMAGAHTLPS